MWLCRSKQKGYQVLTQICVNTRLDRVSLTKLREYCINAYGNMATTDLVYSIALSTSRYPRHSIGQQHILPGYRRLFFLLLFTNILSVSGGELNSNLLKICTV